MVKSILDIEVNSDEFKEFQELFEKYQKQVQALPGAWGNINKEAKTGFEAATAALLAQGEMNRRAQNAIREETQNAKSSAGYWKSTADSTAKVASNLYRATQSLVRWAGLATELGGLLGLGGLWGLDRLAGSVGNARRTNQGLDINQGERAAFNLNYGRVVDTGSLLTDVNEALHDPASLYKLYAAGLSPDQMKGDTGQVSLSVLDSYKKLADATDPQMLAAVLKARGGLMSLQDFERLKSLSPDEYGDIRKSYLKDRSGLAMSDKMQKQWQDFNVQLSRAGQNIENAFITGLTPLIPKLTDLSRVTADLVTKFLKWADKSGAIDKVGEGIEWLANYLSSDDFRNKLKEFGTDIVAIAGAIHTGLVKLGLVPSDSKNPNMKGNVAQKIKGVLQDDNPEAFGRWAGLLPAIAKQESGDTGGFYKKDVRDKEGKIIHKAGDVVVSPAGARGKYQIMPATAAGLGVNPDNPADAAHGAAILLGQYADKYHNDVVKMLAAYNWGPGDKKHPRLDADIAKHPDDWYEHLPRETSAYIKGILKNPEAFRLASRSPEARNDPKYKRELEAFTNGSMDADQESISKTKPDLQRYLPVDESKRQAEHIFSGKASTPSKDMRLAPTPSVNVSIFNYTGSDIVTTAGQTAR